MISNPNELWTEKRHGLTILRARYEPLASADLPAARPRHPGKADVFTYLCPDFRSHKLFPLPSGRLTYDKVAVLEVSTHAAYLAALSPKRRKWVRRAERDLTVGEEPWLAAARTVHTVFNETPTRQGARFPHYGAPFQQVVNGMRNGGIWIVARHRGPVDIDATGIGFAHLVGHGATCMLEQLLSLATCRDLNPNDALVSEAVAWCERKGWPYLTYGRMGTGTHPTLDQFKAHHGFRPVECRRCTVGLTAIGRLAVKLHLDLPVQDIVPDWARPAALRIRNLARR